MKRSLQTFVASALLFTASAVLTEARADTFDFAFAGGGVSGSLSFTYGATTDAKYPNAYELTSVTGSFSDTTLGIVNATVGALVPITRDEPEAGNLLAPNDFSRFFVATGLAHGSLSFDNLIWPGGSPQTATDYPGAGGFLDIYGALFEIGGGRFVNLFSNGDFGAGADYGVAVVTAEQALHYVEGGVVPVPEPGTYALFGAGLVAVAALRRRTGEPRAVSGVRNSAIALACASMALLSSCGGGSNDEGRPLPEAIASVMNKPVYRNAVWGLRVVDPATGEVIYSVDPKRNLLIASVRKTFSVGLTLDALGAAHRFHTPVYRQGAVDVGGALDGDLILVASGDMSMGGRANPDGSYAITALDHSEANELGDAQLTAPDPLAGYKALAAQIKAAGIKHVRGDVVIDERLWEPFAFREQFQVSPIFVNDDLVDIAITPGAVGSPANVVSRPLSAAFQVQSTVTTAAAGSRIDLTRTPALPNCFGTLACGGTLSGAVPVDGVGPLTGQLPLVRTFRITQPAAYARTVLIEALTAAGVLVDAASVAPNPSGKLPAATAYSPAMQMAELVSAPYADHARHIMKVSYNLGADTALMHYGLAHGVRTQTDALAEERKSLARDFGINPDEFQFVDGSGDGETRASNRAVIGLLTAMAQRAVSSDFTATLPILGVDGSLAQVRNFMGDPTLAGAQGQVLAKTGTFVDPRSTENALLIRAKVLAGYIHARSGRTLVYHLVVNDMAPVSALSDLINVSQDLGVISAVIWREN